MEPPNGEVTVTDRLWRKQVLPTGKVAFGRELNFTPARLAGITDAFTAGALNMVPFTAGIRAGGR